MRNLITAFGVEFLKIRKSKILLVTIMIFTIVPLMMGLMLFISRNPEIGEKLGIIGTKAKMFGENDWQGYFSLLNQAMAIIGLIGFGFVTSWVFGREHIDRTLKDTLALPVHRSSIVLAKIVISFIWCIVLAVVLYLVGISLGLAMKLPGLSVESLHHFTRNFFITTLLTLFLSSPISWLAGYSQGIIAPLGFVIFAMIMAQFAGLIGLGPYFPWSIPGCFSVDRDMPGFQLHPSSYIILLMTFFLGYLATLRWWNHADHH